jgi:hypothetical protein
VQGVKSRLVQETRSFHWTTVANARKLVSKLFETLHVALCPKAASSKSEERGAKAKGTLPNFFLFIFGYWFMEVVFYVVIALRRHFV